MRLLLSQKNEFYKIIEGIQFLSPIQFSFIEPTNAEGGSISISLKDTEFIFSIYEDLHYVKSYFLNYIPGVDVYKETTASLSWDDILDNFYIWLENINRELKEPNYWAQFEYQLAAANIHSNINNSKFTVREYEELKMKVDNLSHNIESIPLPTEQLSDIKEELKRLIVLAKDYGKYDWLNLFVGSMISIFIQLSVTKENVVLLWEVIKSAFVNYFLK